MNERSRTEAACSLKYRPLHVGQTIVIESDDVEKGL
jgi:hypothetical protein